MRTIAETHQPEVPYRVRRRLGPWITRLGRTIGQPEYRVRDTEYVGTDRQPLDVFTETFQDHGFGWDPLAWYHQPPIGSEPDGSWTSRRTLFADRQIHVILIAHSPEYIDVFPPQEYSWVRPPINHLRQVGIYRNAGSTEVRLGIASNGTPVDVKSRHRRRIAPQGHDLRKYLESLIQ